MSQPSSRNSVYPDLVDLTLSPHSSPSPAISSTHPSARSAAPLVSSLNGNRSSVAEDYRAFQKSRPQKKVIEDPDEELPSSQQSASSFDVSFGSSILKSKAPCRGTPKSSRRMEHQQVHSAAGLPYGSYIKPGTGAFSAPNRPKSSQPDPFGYRNGWPEWVAKPVNALPPQAAAAILPTPPESQASSDPDGGEEFDLGTVQYTAADFERTHGDAEEEMRELLAGAIGDGEDETIEEGDDRVAGFAKGVKLMPHQVRGVKWMRERESGRKRGGILADDMGLGKTVQTIARIVEGRPTAAEKKVFKAGTLIVAPLAVMEQWASELKSKTSPGLLKVYMHHGPRRTKVPADLEKYDVVITTFQILGSEYGALASNGSTATSAPSSAPASDSDSADSFILQRKPKAKTKKPAAKPNALFKVKWLRVVIDEAQNIKNHRTKASKAACELEAKYRWCLTGTPIQNKVEDLYALFKFLRAKPLDNWQNFRSRIASEVNEGRTGVAMKRLHVILKAIMLRRTKNATLNGKPILSLTERNVEVVECEFDNDERTFYDALEQRTVMRINKFVRTSGLQSNYMSMLILLLRLRQACNHPLLVTKALEKDHDALEPQKTPAGDEADELADMLAGMGMKEKRCELCSEVLKGSNDQFCEPCAELTHNAVKMEARNDDTPSSTKIRAIMRILREIDERSNRQDKTIVFSQFTTFLDLVEPFLKRDGVKYVRYDGSMNNVKRQAVLESIRSKPGIRVILISFKAGSTGLNLTCCNNVIMSDLWWNPALEDQAYDRAHRLGQTKDVNIYKLTVTKTVDDRILALQNMKRELADAALSGTMSSNMKLTMNEMMKLFQPNATE